MASDGFVYCTLCLGRITGDRGFIVQRLALPEYDLGETASYSRCVLCYSLMGEWQSVVSLVCMLEPNDLLVKSRIESVAYLLDERFSGGASRIRDVPLDDFWEKRYFVDIRRRAMFHLVMMLRTVVLHHPECSEKVAWVITHIGSIIE
jgi:hypothetical protein